MSPEHWQKIKEIFNEAVELASAEQEAFLQNRSGANTEVLAEVRKLLAAEKENNFVAPVANVSYLWQENAPEDFLGRQIGGYQIRREIGRGGMGIVFEAAREAEDFSQKVALKILQRGMDSDVLVRRFRHERQILASLEHPNIARLLDGGRSADGTSFLAMEFVEGKPLDEFCAENNLPLSERLRLFLQVCAAVSFAHSRLVVHRDLKPSNILVTANGTAKLLDFGIAKILTPENESLNQTVTQLGMMTPQYASPEQIKGEIVTTSSDIYSLGLILYELLTGEKAYIFPVNRPDQIAKIICEDEPTRPSAIMSRQSAINDQTASGQGQTTNPKSKITTPKSLRGDLDTIILKALRKEPARRYASVEQFANDIKNHLEGLPVIARPDTLSYRLEKFVKRNRVYVMAGILVFFALAGGAALASWQAYRAKQQQTLAEQRFNQVRELANNIVFKYHDEAEKLPNSTVLRQMFVDDSLAYFNSLAQDANADDQLKSELARTFLRIGKVQGMPSFPNLGNTSGAIENYRKGIEILEPLAEKSSDTILRGDLVRACAEYGVLLRQSGENAESNKAFEKSVTFAEKFLRDSPNDEYLLGKVAAAYVFRADTLPVGTGAGENIEGFEEVIAVSEKIVALKPDDLRGNNTLAIGCERKGNTLLNLAVVARETEDFDTAKNHLAETRRLFDRYIEISEKLLRLYPDQLIAPALHASANISQATYLTETGAYAEALQHLHKADDFYGKQLANDDSHVGLKSQVADIEHRFGIVYFRLGLVTEAEMHFARAFELIEKAVRTDAANFSAVKQRAEMRFSYADEILRRRDANSARNAYRQAFDELFQTIQTKDDEYAQSVQAIYLEKLGDCASAENDDETAVAEYQKALRLRQENAVQNLQGNADKTTIFVLEKKIARHKNI